MLGAREATSKALGLTDAPLQGSDATSGKFLEHQLDASLRGQREVAGATVPKGDLSFRRGVG